MKVGVKFGSGTRGRPLTQRQFTMEDGRWKMLDVFFV